MVDTQDDQRGCVNDERCRGYDTLTKRPADTPDPFCGDCLPVAERDIRSLTYDYLDLAQLHQASLSQALHEHVGGTAESPLLIAGHVEALQAEMLHVLTTWETEVRVAARLSDPAENPVPIASWHTTLTLRPPAAKVRDGAAVQRAVNVLMPRVRLLSMLPPTAVCRTGAEDPPDDVAGWEAVQHLQSLHGTARSILGRTQRTMHLPGECPQADAADEKDRCTGQLFRDEPRYAEDPCPIYCGTCGAQQTQEQYEQYVGGLLAPRKRTPATQDAA